ncbi:MAG: 2-amino-4-hydroxy-6-hydroxymethyldihydropteridine diphosphokinase [Pseudomonadota bacterium]
MVSCLVGIGSNLGNPLATLQWLYALWPSTPFHENARFSSIYSSAPIGPGLQQDYLNAVVIFDFDSGSAANALEGLQHIENLAGRVRAERWGPRVLDLDLLLFGERVVNEPALTVPHPRMWERNFVIAPMTDLLGQNWLTPMGISLADQLKRCEPNRIQLTSHSWFGDITADESEDRTPAALTTSRPAYASGGAKAKVRRQPEP